MMRGAILGGKSGLFESQVFELFSAKPNLKVKSMPIPSACFFGGAMRKGKNTVAKLWYNTATKKECIMPVIVPVRELKDTNRISELCNREKRPVFITKNGYGDMVIMSMAYYEETLGRNAIYGKLEEARADVVAGRTKPLRKVLAKQRAKFHVHA